ncbi:predicted protein [Histoplasma capsulatum G186AR]|uniref:Uncharacterized protein n=1 Tax=Ajellomyces capsulatus (strain G186AR / H82 / ATCC MYA-2454 / RMSCC 2432) TaxID=447093 RepID=C0NLQ9_AJECG|nr:uncharacterized protein HCBG_04439 [Histoplasma capsulatum G186AR]EEH07560.1 predicted protein [Histoplasma capsulatum G186AR]
MLAALDRYEDDVGSNALCDPYGLYSLFLHLFAVNFLTWKELEYNSRSIRAIRLERRGKKYRLLEKGTRPGCNSVQRTVPLRSSSETKLEDTMLAGRSASLSGLLQNRGSAVRNRNDDERPRSRQGCCCDLQLGGYLAYLYRIEYCSCLCCYYTTGNQSVMTPPSVPISSTRMMCHLRVISWTFGERLFVWRPLHRQANKSLPDVRVFRYPFSKPDLLLLLTTHPLEGKTAVYSTASHEIARGSPGLIFKTENVRISCLELWAMFSELVIKLTHKSDGDVAYGGTPAKHNSIFY